MTTAKYIIPPERVHKDNSNIRRHSDYLWRELRKLRFKPANPDLFTNEMAAERMRQKDEIDVCFDHDIYLFMQQYLTHRESEIFYLFLYGGGMTQTEIAASCGVCQATVANDLRRILDTFKEYYYGEAA